MRIKKLEIFGFKSFADRVVINYDEGVTGIVGPNGCGKSNVVDALRWVMGEQNAKHLRGDAMKDIIFNGSSNRSPMGLAEVVLTLENDGNLVPPEYRHFSEIEVARRLYKNGESEYEINKQPCRLKDITELFLGTGVGTKAYSIIEQGRVANIVGAKPEERRQFIEEAAGITKYKARRQAAERKMEATKQNLFRITDVRKEVESRLGSLEKQARKAAQYHALMEEIKDIDCHHATLQFFELNNKVNLLSKDHRFLAEEIAGKEEVLREHDLRMSKERDALLAEEKQLTLTREILFEAENISALSKQDIQHLESQLLQRQKHVLQLHEEMRRQEERLHRFQEERVKHADEYEAIIGDFEEEDSSVKASAEELKVLSDLRAQKARDFQDLQRKFLVSGQEATKSQADLKELERTFESLKEKQQRLSQERSALEEQIATQNARSASIKESLSSDQDKMEHLTEALASCQEELLAKVSQKQTTEASRVELLGTISSLKSRLSSLQQIEQSYEWGADGIAELMKGPHAQQLMGLIADCLDVPNELENTVELALKQHLETVIVRNAADAMELIALLSDQQMGRLRFCPVENLTQLDAEPALIGARRLSEVLKVNPGKDERLLRLFDAFLLVDDAQAATKAWPLARKGGLTLLTKAGEIFSTDGTLSGGSGAPSGVLKRKREIKELIESLQVEEEKLVLLDESLQGFLLQVGLLEEKKKELQNLLQSLSVQVARLEESLRAKKDESDRMGKQIASLAAEEVQVQAAQGSSKERHEALNALWAKALETHRQHGELIQSEQESLADIEYQVAQKSELVTALRVKAAAKQERVQSLERAILQCDTNIKDAIDTKSNLKEQETQNQLDQGSFTEQKTFATEKLEKAEAEKAVLTKKMAAQKESYDRMAQELRRKENGIHDLRVDLQEHKDKLGSILLSSQEVRLSISAMRERLFERHQLYPEDVLTDYHHLPPPDFNVEKRLAELRRQIDGLGAINPTAVQEFEELNARYIFLKTQSDDLAHALEQLEAAIGKINAMTIQRFDEAFKAINLRFSQVFPRLFRGGKAWLELTQPDDLLATGVEIFAQPPGKKLGSIALMSGGEKALTAISLIFAIFLMKPSPFCLLDEVDAPLDEANVERFSQIVKEMSKVSQFIVITHNKRTMEIADQLYGVTMEQPGVSKTVHVKVSQALKQQEMAFADENRIANGGLFDNPTA